MKVNKCTCGQEFDEDLLLDSLYPIGREPDSLWEMNCKFSNDGCGKMVLAESKQAAITLWNEYNAPDIDDNANVGDYSTIDKDDIIASVSGLIVVAAIIVLGIVIAYGSMS